MDTATMYSSFLTHPYDIHPNDFLNQKHQVPIDGTFGMGPGQPFYHSPSHNGVQSPTFPYPVPFQHHGNLSYFQPPHVGLAPTLLTNRVTYHGYHGGLPPNFQPYNVVPHFQTQPTFTT